MHEEGPEAEIALHGLDHGDADALAGLGGEAGGLVDDEDLVVLV
jgi:hypothetical protein